MINIEHYGFSSDRPLIGQSGAGTVLARVTAVYRDLYKVISCYGDADAKLKGSFYRLLRDTGDTGLFPAVGDFVQIQPNEFGCSLITGVYERQSKFSRTDFSGHKVGHAKTILEQVLAANFDAVWILMSLNQNFNLRRIERYLAAAWQSGGTPVIVLTKADLAADSREQVRATQAIAGDAAVYAVSALTGFGMDRLAADLMPGQTIVFLGSSGVGKSSLVNALAHETLMKVSAIRQDDARGRHTTTHRQLILLNNGVMVIDTPGLRELGMWDADEGIGEVFADVEDLQAACRFANCGHKSEPGCAIKAALHDGRLEEKRWQTYLLLKRETRFNELRSRKV